jgi:hypothetical protein
VNDRLDAHGFRIIRRKTYHSKWVKKDEFVKSPLAVIPAKAGIHKLLKSLDPGLRRGDDIRRFRTFYEVIKKGLPGR